MIRDPSDGTIREKPVAGIPTAKPTGAENAQVQSGLPIMGDPREVERLNRAREWLKTYQKGQPT